VAVNNKVRCSNYVDFIICTCFFGRLRQRSICSSDINQRKW